MEHLEASWLLVWIPWDFEWPPSTHGFLIQQISLMKISLKLGNIFIQRAKIGKSSAMKILRTPWKVTAKATENRRWAPNRKISLSPCHGTVVARRRFPPIRPWESFE